jgi:hypothetical protein
VRKWTRSEQRLLTVLGIALFLMGSFYLISYLLDISNGLALKISDLEASANTDQIWLREKQFWLDRKEWIDQKQPRVATGTVPQSELLQSLTASAQNHKLTIQEQSFADAKSTPEYKAVAVRLKVTGTLEDVVRWLVDIQQPEKFQAVTDLSLKSQEKPPAVDLELEVARWYSPHA